MPPGSKSPIFLTSCSELSGLHLGYSTHGILDIYDRYIIIFIGYIIYLYIYMWGPRLIAKLVQISPISMVYAIYNELVTGAYKPTYNWGASHCMEYKFNYRHCIPMVFRWYCHWTVYSQQQTLVHYNGNSIPILIVYVVSPLKSHWKPVFFLDMIVEESSTNYLYRRHFAIATLNN